MPMIGVVDPTHKARKGHWQGYPPWLPLSEVLAEAEVASPKWAPWPYELIASLVAEHQERGARLSVTALTGGCMRGNIVERKEDYIGTLDGMYPMLRGTLIHSALERGARPGALAEWRFYSDVDGQEISGSPDLVTYDTIWDYKTTDKPPKYDYMWPNHNLQLQYNRFLFNNATKWDAPKGIDPATISLDPFHTKIQHLAIVYLGPDGPKVLEAEVARATRTGGRKFRVPDVWTDTQVLADLRPRMESWKMAWESYPQWPAGLENFPGFEGPPEWKCFGPPLCYLPACAAKRLPYGLVWPREGLAA